MTDVKRERQKTVVSIQGPIQLVSAIAALQCQFGSLYRDEFHLIVSDLYIRQDQRQEFFESIKDLALRLCPWESVSLFPQEVLDQFDDKRAIEILSSDLKNLRTDWLFVSTDSHLGNNALIRLLDCEHIACFGDGPSIYIPRSYYYLTRNVPPSYKFRVLKEIAWRLGLIKSKSIFECGFFLLPSIYGEKPKFPYTRLRHEEFLRIFRHLSAVISDEYESLIKTIESSADTAILLTSNFSEGGKLTAANESLLYVEFLKSRGVEATSTIVFKPHPRDALDKIHLVRRQLELHFSEVFVLDSGRQKFLPFEITLLCLENTLGDGYWHRMRFFSFSTAAISLEYIMGIEVETGFGRRLVSLFFDREESKHRISHEKDLSRTLKKVRRYRQRLG